MTGLMLWTVEMYTDFFPWLCDCCWSNRQFAAVLQGIYGHNNLDWIGIESQNAYTFIVFSPNTSSFIMKRLTQTWCYMCSNHAVMSVCSFTFGDLQLHGITAGQNVSNFFT